tara:strand:- start:391 stop:1029 length:639 start_codon:yes stop_codon:yes gene_type:complete
MRLKKMQNGGRPSSRDAIPQYSSMEEYMSLSPYERGGSGAVENTFGPEDYILGAFPLARALSPAARAIGKYLGLGKKAAKPKITYDQFGRVTNPEIVAAQNKRTAAMMDKARTNKIALEYRPKSGGEQFLFDGTVDRLRKQGMPEKDIQRYMIDNGSRAQYEAELAELTKSQDRIVNMLKAEDRLQNIISSPFREGPMGPINMNNKGGRVKK